MDYYMNRRRTECGRSQIFSVPSEAPVNMQCCCPPPDQSGTASSDSQSVLTPNTSMIQPVFTPNASMSQPVLTPNTSMNQPVLTPNTSMNRPSVSQEPSGSGSQSSSLANSRYFPTGSLTCPGSLASHTERYPLGMGYVPMQQWGRTYGLAEGFSRGTIFPELDLPFVMGRCQ